MQNCAQKEEWFNVLEKDRVFGVRYVDHQSRPFTPKIEDYFLAQKSVFQREREKNDRVFRVQKCELRATRTIQPWYS